MGSRKKGRLSKNKNHAQDCGTLIEAGDQRPAILPWFLDFGWRPSLRVIRAPCPLCPAAGLLLDCQSARTRTPKRGARLSCPGCSPSTARIRRARSLDEKPLNKRFRSKSRAKTRAVWRAQELLTTNVVLLEQRLVARLVLLLHIVEERAAGRDQLQEAATRMVVLHVGLEMVGEVGDAFRQDRDLNLWRAGIAGLVGIRLDDFRFAFCGNRHRQFLSLRSALAVRPVRLNTRLGMISPLPTSASARSRPATVT